MKHQIAIYITESQKSKKLDTKSLAAKSKLSETEIRRLKKDGTRLSLSPITFYKLITAFEDSFQDAIEIVYPGCDFTLKKHIPKERNEFGKLMSRFESSVNSLEEISDKTGITLNRLKQIYFKTGFPDSYELILLEKAVGLPPGDLFKELLGSAK